MTCRLCLICLLAQLCAVSCYQHLSFDTAHASSTYTSGDSPFAFVAGEATAPGTGYWCSSGAHAPGQIVTWTGALDTRRSIAGIVLDWAYAPGEWKLLVSPDGSNFEEAQGWQMASRSEASYGHTVMFEAALAVRAVAIVMRSPRSWGYFGLSRAALLAEPGPIMIVSGVSASAGEMCLSASGNAAVQLKPCLATIAAGDGSDIFEFTSQGELENVASGACVTSTDGDAAGDSSVVMASCHTRSTRSDGLSRWDLNTNGQLRLTGSSSSCLMAAEPSGGLGAFPSLLGGSHGSQAAYGLPSTTPLIMRSCVEAARSSDARDQFFMVSVPSFDPGASFIAGDAAVLVNAATAHLEHLVGELRGAEGALRSCGKAGALFCEHALRSGRAEHNNTLQARGCKTQDAEPTTGPRMPHILSRAGKQTDVVAQAIAAMGDELRVDFDGLIAVVNRAREAISLAQGLAPHFSIVDLSSHH